MCEPVVSAAAVITQAIGEIDEKKYPADLLNARIKNLKILKDGQWLPLPPLQTFNPNLHIRIHPSQLFPLWHYFFEDRTALTLVETNEEVLFYHTESRPASARLPPRVEVKILNMQTKKYLIDQAILHHGRLLNYCSEMDLGSGKKNVVKLADECHVLFMRVTYQRIMKMGLDPKSITLRAFEAHKRWLEVMQPT